MPTPLYYFKNLLFIPDILKNDLESRLLDFENSSKNNCFDFSVYSDFEKELKSAFIMSGFIARSLVKDPSIITSLLETGDLARVYRPFEISSKVRTIKESSESIENFSLKIRQLRLREMVRIAWRDINGLSDLDETMEDLSCLAESCVDEILDFIHCKLAEKTGFPKKSDGSDQRLVVLGMGKLGARELNFSSDIDGYILTLTQIKENFIDTRNNAKDIENKYEGE